MMETGKQAMTESTQGNDATLELLHFALSVRQEQEGHGVLGVGTLRDNWYRKMEYLVIGDLENSTLERRWQVISRSFKMIRYRCTNSGCSSFHLILERHSMSRL
ncbi:hypothetical protein BDK51DRAFT_30665, partial [Blyttiomyces helicus]